MSSSSVCQGLQSRVLRLKLASTRSLSLSETQEKSSTDDEIYTKMHKNADMGGWSFLLSLNKTEDPHADNVYVHPAVKRSSSMLTGKSLEMCTESLGCETGSDNASENIDEIALLSLENSNISFTRHTTEASRNSVSKRTNRSGSFPPPLTSITDLGGVQVRPHREEGRLILKAVATPSVQPYFQAERRNGRLTLRLFETCTSDDEKEELADDDEEGVVVDDEEDTEADELEGNNEIVDDEMGKRKLSRPRRCNESGKRNKERLANWEPFWVAT